MRVSDQQVVVLAGGLGTRLRSLGGDLPKALRPVAGQPFLDVMLGPLLREGFRRFHFCLGAHGEYLAQHLTRLDPRLEVTFEVEDVPSGTAGALLQSSSRLDELFLTVMGDTFFEFPYGSLVGSLPEVAEGLMVVSSGDSGVEPNVQLTDTTIVGYDKAGVTGEWTDTGVAVLRRRALDSLQEADLPLDLSQLFLSLIKRHSLHAITTDRRFFDIGTPDRYRHFDTLVRTAPPGGAARC